MERLADGVWDVTRHFQGRHGRRGGRDIRKVTYDKEGKRKREYISNGIIVTQGGALPVSFRAPRPRRWVEDIRWIFLLVEGMGDGDAAAKSGNWEKKLQAAD